MSNENCLDGKKIKSNVSIVINKDAHKEEIEVCGDSTVSIEPEAEVSVAVTEPDVAQPIENNGEAGTIDVQPDSGCDDGPEEKKEKRPSIIELRDKSEQFKKIIDIALAIEKMEEESKRLKGKNKNLTEQVKELKEDKEELRANLELTQNTCEEKQKEIVSLQEEINNRNEVIDIVKADKSESLQEFKNALGAALKIYIQDFKELKEVEMSEDIGYALVETIENIIKTLGNNGINI